jgi:hypothetical protein
VHSPPFDILSQKWSLMIAERERDDIAEWLDDLLTEWVQHTSTREKGEQLAGRIRRLFSLSRSEKPPVGRFAKYTRAKYAVQDILDEAGRALPPEDIKAAVLAGGFKAGKRDRDVDVDKCLGAYKPSAKQTRTSLRWMNGLVGRGEWPDDRFQ